MHLDLQKKGKFNGYSDSRSVQENFNLITTFIQDSADKHIPSKTSRSVSSDKEDTLKLQRDIDRLGNWARKWGMRFQPVKCNMMQLT